MVGILVKNIVCAEERLAFRRAVGPYEYPSSNNACLLRRFDEVANYVPKHPDRTAFVVFCPVLEFLDGSILEYHLAGILFRRFETSRKMRAFVAKNSDWFSFSRKNILECLLRVELVLEGSPDRGEFLDCVRRPVSPPAKEKNVRSNRNPPERSFQPMPPMTRDDVRDHVARKRAKA